MKFDRPLITSPRRIEWHPGGLPDRIPPGMVRIRSLMSLISPGTELRLYRGEPMVEEVWEGFAEIDEVTSTGMGVLPAYRVTPRNRPGEARYPVCFGYNCLGEVVEAGEGVEGPAPGDRVFCLARHQPVFDVDGWQALPVPDGVPDRAVPFAYLPTLGLHALRRGGFTPGGNVAVIGLGLIGMGAALVADALGAGLACFDIHRGRRERAAAALPHALVLDPGEEGMEERIMERFTPFGFDVVLEAAAGPAPLDLGMRLLDDGGRMVAIALHPEDAGPLLSADFYNKQAAVLGTSNAPYVDPSLRRTRFTVSANTAFVLRLHGQGRLDLGALHTHTYPASEAARAFADLDAGTEDMVGVLLDWRAP